VLLEGLEWGTSEAVDKLKKMLWGLEALRVFDDRLSASLAQIQKAQDAMERTVKQVCRALLSSRGQHLNLTHRSRKLASNMLTCCKSTIMSSKSSRNAMGCSQMFILERS
jgi:hypothetical protein